MGQARPLRTESFSTRAVPAHDRHEAWENRHWPSLAPLFATTPLAPFNAVSETLRLGGVVVTYAQMTAQRWSRDAARTRSTEHDALGINIGLAGSARGLMAGRDFRQPAGTAIVCDFNQTSLHDATGGRSIQLVIPRAVAAEAGLDVSALHGLVVDSPALRLLTAHALQLRKSLRGLCEEDVPQLARSMTELVALAIGQAMPSAAACGQAATSTLMLRARDEIELNLGSPALSIANLCRRLQVSRSTLHRLFEAEGGIQAYIRHRRLDAARRALERGGPHERIGALAERLGFTDSAHLSRLFRQRFGQTPSECRAKAGGRDAGIA